MSNGGPWPTHELAAGLRALAAWTRDAQNPESPPHRRISIDDVDDNLLDEAAARLELLSPPPPRET